VQEHKESTTLKGRITEKGQPGMRQALKLGLLNKNVSNYSSPVESTPGESVDKLDKYKRRK